MRVGILLMEVSPEEQHKLTKQRPVASRKVATLNVA